MNHRHVVIVGAGVIGAATALVLQREHHAVTLLDRAGPAAGASFGNAGAIVNGSCAPTAMPGVWREALASLTDPASPLTVRPAYLPQAMPWLLRFLAESREDRVETLAASLYALSCRAAESWRWLTDGTPLSRFIEDGGWLKVYENNQQFDETAAARALLDANGSPYEILNADELRDLEPALAPVFSRAILQPDSLRIVSPGRLVTAMVERFVAAGGEFRQLDVTSVAGERDSVRISGNGETIDADSAVIAAGAWSKHLATMNGSAVPLDTERGYHVMFPAGSGDLIGRPILHGGRSFVLSPMTDGLRMTAQVEIAGVHAAPDYRRIRGLLPEAKHMLPALDATEQSVWMGCRPSLPDSLPAIGPSAASDSVILAFGHQHLGMTLAAVTAKLVADLIGERSPHIDIEPYRAGRF